MCCEKGHKITDLTFLLFHNQHLLILKEMNVYCRWLKICKELWHGGCSKLRSLYDLLFRRLMGTCTITHFVVRNTKVFIHKASCVCINQIYIWLHRAQFTWRFFYSRLSSLSLEASSLIYCTLTVIRSLLRRIGKCFMELYSPRRYV